MNTNRNGIRVLPDTRPTLNRLPLEAEVTWLQSRPEIRIRLTGSDRGEVIFKTDEPNELLGQVVNAYAHLFVAYEKVCRENRNLRRGL